MDNIYEEYSVILTNTTFVYAADAFILIWTFGNVFKEFQTMWFEGFLSYHSDWINSLNTILNFCFISATFIRYSFIIFEGYKVIELLSDEYMHPLQVSDCFKAIGLLLLFVKFYKLLRLTELVGRPQFLLTQAFKSSMYFFVTFLVVLISFTVCCNGLIAATYADFLRNCARFNLENSSSPVNSKIPCADRFLSRESILQMTDYQNFPNLLNILFFNIFEAKSRIVTNFPAFENPQEWTLVILYTTYAFFMNIIRLNILISLIIFAVLNACREDNSVFRFRRTMLMFMYIGGADPLPPPFNIFPSVYRITAAAKEKQKEKRNIFSSSIIPQKHASYMLIYLSRVSRKFFTLVPER